MRGDGLTNANVVRTFWRMIDFESQSARILLALARGRNRIDVARCSLAFAYLGTAERLRSGLRRALARHKLSDLQFAILVLLFAAEPASVPMAVLAHRAGVSRSAVTDAFDGLDASGLASRARDRDDRRIIHGRITAAGREKIEKAIDDYLNVTTQTAGCVEELEQHRYPTSLISEGGSCHQAARHSLSSSARLDAGNCAQVS